MLLEFKSWPKFRAKVDETKIRSWLHRIRAKSQSAFASGMLGSHSGRFYPGNTRRSSAPGEYPASQTGALLASAKSHQRRREVGIGTNEYYAKFLAEGTRFMAKRKMSKEALQEGKRGAGSPRGWVDWKKG